MRADRIVEHYYDTVHFDDLYEDVKAFIIIKGLLSEDAFSKTLKLIQSIVN